MNGSKRCTRTKCVRRRRARVTTRPRPSTFPSTRRPGPARSATALARKWFLDEALVVPDMELPLDGAIQPWRRAGKRLIIYYKAMLRSVCRAFQCQHGDALQGFAGRFQKGSAQRLGRR
ncbi:MAG: hypothetical protein WDM80_16945 [Limisphaerales bacterium]